MKTIESSLNWAVNGSLNVVLVQLALPPDLVWQNDQSRPAAVSALANLLSQEQGRKLSHLAPGADPVLVACPELAFGTGDWNAVDAMVRSHPYPLMLFAGFGAALGSDLQTWQSQNGTTQKIVAWEDAPEPARRYPGGWCWIHEPGASTKCISFMKTSLDERHEQVQNNLAKGKNNICIRTPDLVIFTAICSDWTEVNNGRYLLHERIRTELNEVEVGARRILFLGMMSQEHIHDAWASAILAASQIDMQRTNICLINSAYNGSRYEEASDRWRAYSGVYLAKQIGRTPLEPDFNPVRGLPDAMLFGAVTRTTGECVIAGRMRWDFPAGGRHAWAANASFEIRPDGTFVLDVCKDRLEFEAHRFVRRLIDPADVPLISKKSFVRDSLKKVAEHFESRKLPVAGRVMEATAYGIPDTEGAWPKINGDKLWENKDDLEAGLRILGAAALEGAAWADQKEAPGQLNFRGVNLLVWSAIERGMAIISKLRRLRTQRICEGPLVVVTKAALKDVLPDVSKRRDRIGSPPRGDKRSISEPTAENLVGQISLDDFDACFDHDQPAQCSAAVKGLLKSNIDKIMDEGVGR